MKLGPGDPTAARAPWPWRRRVRLDRGRRLVEGIALVREPGYGRGQRFADLGVVIERYLVTGPQLLDQVQQSRPALARLVQPDVQVGDPPEAQTRPQLAAD